MAALRSVQACARGAGLLRPRALAVALAVLAVGCQTAPAPRPTPQVQARVVGGGAAIVDEQTAARLRLESRYAQARAMLSAGQREEGLAELRAVAREAGQGGVALSAPVREGLDAVLSAAASESGPGALAASSPVTPPEEAQPAEPATPGGAREPAAPYEPIYMPALQEPGAADRMVSLDFDQVDIRLVLKTVSDLTGVNFLVHEDVSGTVTLMSPTQIRLGDVFRVLESVLAVRGYAAVPAGDVVKIVPRGEVARHNVPTFVGSDPSAIPEDDTVRTQIIPLRHVKPDDVMAWATEVAGADASVFSPASTNTIVITGASSGIHQLAKLIEEFDIPAAQEDVVIIPLKHAPAASLAGQISEIMGQAEAPAAAAQRPQAGPPAAAARGGVPPRGAPTTVSVASRTRIIPEPRTNSLIVVALPEDVQTVRRLVEQLDVERPLGAEYVHVVYLQHAEAEELAAAVSAQAEGLRTAGGAGGGEAVAPLRITADKSTNALIITASPLDFAVIADMIEKLDVAREQVLVEMWIVEASEQVVRSLGIEWSTVDPASADGLRGFGQTDFGIGVDYLDGTLEGLAIGAFKLGSGGSTRIAAILNALETTSGVNILSKPLVLTSNHQEAEIIVAENIPFVTQSRITETDPSTPTAIRTFEYKDVGIQMRITPHVSRGGMVRLEISSEFSKVIEAPEGVAEETPTTAKRTARTVVSIQDGSTVVIGGLMRDDNVESASKVPFLGDLPLIGVLFRRTKTTVQKTDLLLFITPRVLTTREDLEQVTAEREATLSRSPRQPAPAL